MIRLISNLVFDLLVLVLASDILYLYYMGGWTESGIVLFLELLFLYSVMGFALGKLCVDIYYG